MTTFNLSLSLKTGRALRSLTQLSSAAMKLGKSLDGVQAKMDRLGGTAAKYQASSAMAARSTSELAKNTGALTGATGRLGGMLGGVVAKLAAVASGVVAVGLAFRELQTVVSTFAQFEQALAAVQAVTSAGADGMARLTDQAKMLGETTRFSAAEAASGMEFFGRAGFEVNEILGAMPSALNLAAAAQLDLGRAADITSNIMSAFSVPANEAGRIADALAAAAANANTDVSMMGEAMKFVGPVASAMSISMEDSAAAIGILSNAGLQASMAGTGLRRVLSELADPSNQAADVLARLGVELSDVDPAITSITQIVDRLADANLGAADAFTIFGDRGAPAILALTSQADQLRELTGRVNESDDVAKKMANTMEDTLAGAARELLSTMEGLRIAIGEQLKPVLVATADRLRKFLVENKDQAVIFGRDLAEGIGTAADAVAWLAENFDNLKAVMLSVVAVVAVLKFGPMVAGIVSAATSLVALEMALGGVGVASGVAAVGVKGLTAAMAANPFGMIAIAAAAAVFAIVKVRDALKGLASDYQDDIDEMVSATNDFQDSLDAIGDGTDSAIASGNLQSMSTLLGEQTTALGESRAAMDAAKEDIDHLRLAQAGLANETGHIPTRMADALKAWNEARREVTALEGATGELISAMRGWAPAAKEGNDEAERQAKLAQDQVNLFAKLSDAAMGQTAEAKRLATAYGQGEKAVRDTLDAMEIENKLRGKAADLTKAQRGELRKLLVDQQKAERVAGGAQTIADLTKQLKAQQALTAATAAGSEAEAAMQEQLTLQADVRKAIAGVADEQREAIEGLVIALHEENKATEIAGRERGVREQIADLVKLREAYGAGATAADAARKALAIEGRVRQATADLIGDQRDAMAALVREREREQLVGGGLESIAALQAEVSQLQALASIKRDAFSTEAEYQQALQDVNTERQVSAALIELEASRLAALTTLKREDFETDAAHLAAVASLNDTYAEQADTIAGLIRSKSDLTVQTQGAADATQTLEDKWMSFGATAVRVLGRVDAGLGQVAGSIFGAVDAFRGLSQARAAGGGGMGSQASMQAGGATAGIVSSVVSATGISGGGTTAFGGERSGNFAEEGAEVGGLFGPMGALVGAFIGAMFDKAGDTAELVLESAQDASGDAILRIEKAEGGLADISKKISQTLTNAVNFLQDQVGAAFDLDAAGLSIEIKDDVVTVRARDGLVKGFRTLDEALSFALEQTLAAQRNVEGLGETVRAVFQGLGGMQMFSDPQDVVDLVNLAQAIDDMGSGRRVTEATQALEIVADAREREIALAQKFNTLSIAGQIPFSKLLDLQNERLRIVKEEIGLARDSFLGVRDSTSAVLDLVASMEQYNAALVEEEARRTELADEAMQRAADLEAGAALPTGVTGGDERPDGRAIAAGGGLGGGGFGDGGGDIIGMGSIEQQEQVFLGSMSAMSTAAVSASTEVTRSMEVAGGDLATTIATVPGEATAAMTGFAEGAAAEAAMATGGVMAGFKSGLMGTSEEVGRATVEAFDTVAASSEKATDVVAREQHRRDQLISGAKEEADAFTESLAGIPEAFSAQEIADLWTAAAAQAGGDLIAMIRQVRGEQFGAAEEQQLMQALFSLQLAAQIQSVIRLLEATETLDAATRSLLEGIVEEGQKVLTELAEGTATVGRRRGGGGQRRQQLEDFNERIADLAARASGASAAVLDINRQFADFDEWAAEARRMGIAEERLATARGDLAKIIEDDILAPYRETIQAAGESDFATDMRQFAEGFGVDLDRSFALATAEAERLGLTVGDTFPAMRDVITEAFGIDMADKFQEEIERLTEAGDVEGLREFMSELEAMDFSGISPDLQAVFESLFSGFMQQAEDAIQEVESRPIDLSSIQGFIDMANGTTATQRKIMDLRKTFADLREEAGATSGDLETIRRAEIAAMEDARASIMKSVQSYTDAAQGIGSFERRFLDMQATFSEARSGLEELSSPQDFADDVGTRMEALQSVVTGGMDDLIEAVRAKFGESAGGAPVAGPEQSFTALGTAMDSTALSARQMTEDVELLDDAQKMATQAMGAEFIGSLESLGAALPSELVMELAFAQWELAKAEAIGAAMTLAAAGAFEGLSITLQDVIDIIEGADFDMSTFAPRGMVGGRPGGRTGGAAPGDDIAQRIADQIEAWNRLALGDVTRRAMDLADTMDDLREAARKARVPVDGLEKAFGVARQAFIDDILTPFEALARSPLENEMVSLVEQFADITMAFAELGASAEDMDRLAEAQATAFDDFWARATAPLQGLLDELEASDPRTSTEQRFREAQEEFRALSAAAQAGDLAAVEQLESVASGLLAQSDMFLGEGLGSLALRDEITATLRDITGATLDPSAMTDPVVAATEEGNSLLTSIRDILAGQPVIFAAPATIAQLPPVGQAPPATQAQGAANASATDQALLRYLAAQEAREKQERERDRTRERNTTSAEIEQREGMITLLRQSIEAQQAIASLLEEQRGQAGGLG